MGTNQDEVHPDLLFHTNYCVFGASFTTGAFPCKKAFTQVVLFTKARWTLKDPIATAAMIIGIPTEGLTTHHNFP
jgi:hypothetical protein